MSPIGLKQSKRTMEVNLPEQQLLLRLRQLAHNGGDGEILVFLRDLSITKVAKVEKLGAERNTPDVQKTS